MKMQPNLPQTVIISLWSTHTAHLGGWGTGIRSTALSNLSHVVIVKTNDRQMNRWSSDRS